MNETGQDIEQLQHLIDQSIEHAGDFLKSSFEMPEHSLSAKQLVAYLDKKITVAFATASSKNAPRVAPIGATFYRAHFCIPTVLEAARTKMLKKNPNISMTYYETVDFAVILHGKGEIIDEAHPDFKGMDEQHQAIYDNSPTNWGGTGIYIRLLPDVLYTYARYIENFK